MSKRLNGSVAVFLLVTFTIGACSRGRSPTSSAGKQNPSIAANPSQDPDPGAQRRKSPTSSAGATNPNGSQESLAEGTIKIDDQPPPRGSYPYQLQLTQNGETELSEGTLKVGEPELSEKHKVTYQFIQRIDSQDVLGVETVWDENAIHIRRHVDKSSPCSYENALLWLPLRLKIGQSWLTETSCIYERQETHLTLRGQFLRQESITIDKGLIDALVVSSTLRMSNGQGLRTIEQIFWFSPLDRLQVKMDATTTYPNKSKIREVEQLASLQPGP